jgi:hypothetical protein
LCPAHDQGFFFFTGGFQGGDMLVSEGAQQLMANGKLNIVPALVTGEALAMLGLGAVGGR